MKIFVSIFTAILVMFTASVTLADIADPYPAQKYNSYVIDTMNASVNDDNTISVSFSLPEKCRYNCKIEKFNGELVKKFNGIYENEDENIKETFEYESPKEGQVNRYFILIKYEVNYKKTIFGSKIIKNPDATELKYMIRVKRENNVDNVEVLDYIYGFRDDESE